MIKREEYYLRKLQEQDLKMVLEWRNSERIRANMYTDHIISWEEHKNWYASLHQKESESYHICEFMNKPIGLVCFNAINLVDENCFWGFYLGELDVPRGSGAAMEFLALEYIFENLGIKKLKCEVFALNKPVIKLHKKFGFIEEEYLTNYILKNGAYLDVLRLSLLATDWFKNKEKLSSLVFR